MYEWGPCSFLQSESNLPRRNWFVKWWTLSRVSPLCPGYCISTPGTMWVCGKCLIHACSRKGRRKEEGSNNLFRLFMERKISAKGFFTTIQNSQILCWPLTRNNFSIECQDWIFVVTAFSIGLKGMLRPDLGSMGKKVIPLCNTVFHSYAQ